MFGCYRSRNSLPQLCAAATLRAAIVLAALAANVAAVANAQNWDRFRGPNGTGQSDANSIPVEWKPANILWRRPLTGIGHSSPVVWGDRVFATSAERESAQQYVAAFDVKSGEPLWEKRLPGQTYPIHAQNSFASNTPTVDAERVYHLWRVGEAAWIVAFTHAGDEVWRREVSKATDENGFGVSPIVIDGIVVTTIDNEIGDSAITGLDAKTGQPRWKVPRPSGKSPYCTPLTIEGPGGKKLLVAASTAAGLCAFDPTNGQPVWKAIEKDLPQRIVGSPIAAGGLVIVSCGLTGNGLVTIAVQTGANGMPPGEAYRITENVPYVPTPVVSGDLLFLWNDRGMVSCHELANGKQIWRQRVGGNFNSSPIRVGDRIYNVSMEGEVVVLAADRQYKLLARNALNEPTSATPAVAGGRMFFRTEGSLICVGEPASASE